MHQKPTPCSSEHPQTTAADGFCLEVSLAEGGLRSQGGRHSAGFCSVHHSQIMQPCPQLKVLAVAFFPPCTVTMQVARQLAPAASAHSFLLRQRRVCHLWLQKEWEQSARKEGSLVVEAIKANSSHATCKASVPSC